MTYIIFNNSILMSDGDTVQRIEKHHDPEQMKLALDNASVCVVDVNVLIAAAAGTQEQIDSILVRKFKALYQHEPHVIQDEEIDNNTYQVIGISEKKVKEVYSLIPPDRVKVFIPYAIALRNTLETNNVKLDKSVVFIDDLESERLLTDFNGKKFSTTRVITHSENIVSEILRSQIDFNKKISDFGGDKNKEYVIVVNSKKLVDEIKKNDNSLSVELLDVQYPAIEGLKEPGTNIKYTLPEENYKKKRVIELRKKAVSFATSIAIVALGLGYFLFAKVELIAANNQLLVAQQEQDRLGAEQAKIDQETYRSDLKVHSTLNFGIVYQSIVDDIPASYQVQSFKFTKNDNWSIEMTLVSDVGGAFEQILPVDQLKNAQINDVFVNNLPGKHLRLSL